MNAIIDAAISHSRTVILTLVLILVAGTVAYQTIPKEDSPDVNIPTLYVSMVHEGISPEDAERLLIKPMEKELRAIEGVKEMTSTAYLGGANVVMEFDAGFDADMALIDVREKVDLAKAELPEDAEEPTVHEINLSLFPVLTVSLSGSAPERTLLRIARDLQDRIEGISSVLEAEIVGDRDELLEVIIDPLALESYNLDAEDILTMVSKSNLVIAAGSLDTGQGRFAVKVPGLFETMEDIVNLPVKVSGDAVVRFRDIATLHRTFKDSDGYARLNGQPSLALEVSKRTGENIIETIEQVRAVVEASRDTWPSTVSVAYSQDKSTDIRNNLLDLQNNVLSAILLVMVVVVAALGIRSACFVGIAIPGSFLTGILVLAVAGLTVNIVVLFALILAVGMLVDGAIVVTEYADRKMSEGLPKKEAYALAGKRMAWPIIAATATTLAAFLPLMFWPGTVGEFMKFLPLTLIATLTASLAMALIFVPTLGSVFGKAGGAADPETMKALAAGESGDLNDIKGWTGRYLKVLNAALNHPGKILLAAVASLVLVMGAYATFGRGVEFFPDVEPQNAVLQLHARGNLSVDERDALVRQVEQVVLAIQREHGEFHAITSQSMASSGQQGGDEAEDVIGKITLEFTDWFTRRPADEILGEIRRRSEIFAGIFVEARKEEAGPPVGKPVQVEVSSSNPALIEPAVKRIAQAMAEMDGFIDIEDGAQIPGIEWELSVDRAQAAKFGADISLIGSYVRMITNGMKLGEYRPDDSSEEIDIVVRLPEAYRTIEQLDRIRMQTSAGLVPISNFVTRLPKQKVGQLKRTDGNRAMTVKADVAPGLLVDDKVQQVRSWLASQQFDSRLTFQFKGEDEEQKAASDFLGKAFAVALFLMAIILVTQFNSFYSAGLILSAVIMSTVGVMIGLLVTHQPFGIVMSGIGVIALAGIVVNNNIVLIDTFDRLRETTQSAREAILRTGAQRLRPVMLTTITTILGLMPMVLAMNIDFFSRTVQIGAPSTQWWRQLSTAIVFGLTFATLLTLVVTPSALMVRANLSAWRARRRDRGAAKRTDADADAKTRGNDKAGRPISEAAE
ncbi:efflux RND transporter permease subunit [Pelagibius sp. 7325]|uniref:efflux RND transporter permease subunit n=1 Tax=Pelagibius sp. 7325 TaxID=3131994 RepID=UPI0030EF977A